MTDSITNGRKRRRSQKSIQTKQTILVQARQIFRERGFDRATTKEIAQVAQVAEGTLFHHFPNKIALLEGMMVDYYEVLQANAEKIVQGQADPRLRLRELVLAHLRSAAEDWAVLRIVVQHGRYGNRSFADSFYKLNKRYTKLYTDLFDQLKDQLYIRRTVPNALIRDTLFGSMEHFMIRHFGYGREPEIEQFVDQLLDLVLFGCGQTPMVSDE